MKDMKALYLYSNKQGLGKSPKYYARLVRKLEKIYQSVTAVECPDVVSLKECLVNRSKDYDVTVFSGGDGTFNLVTNIIAEMDECPLLGYIPTGTINDAGSMLGLGGVHKALKVLRTGEPSYKDIGKINDRYFSYVAAVGCYADIPYLAERKNKKIIGCLAYYFMAVKQLFCKRNYDFTVNVDGREISVKTPFFLLMNGKRVGGFTENAKSSSEDGLFELYLTEPGMFNGLIHYLFGKCKTLKLKGKHFEVHTDCPDDWDIDGERAVSGDVTIDVIPKKLYIIAKKKK